MNKTKDKLFYAQLLGIKSPWYIKCVKVDGHNKKVEVFIDHEVNEQKTKLEKNNMQNR